MLGMMVEAKLILGARASDSSMGDFIAHAEGRCVSSCCGSMLDAKLIWVLELSIVRGVTRVARAPPWGGALEL